MMRNVSASIDPMSTQPVLQNLSLAIEETRLLKQIEKLNNRLDGCSTDFDRSEAKSHLRLQLVLLNYQLIGIRNRAGYFY